VSEDWDLEVFIENDARRPGTFVLTHDGVDSVAIAYGADTATVRAAFQGMRDEHQRRELSCPTTPSGPA